MNTQIGLEKCLPFISSELQPGGTPPVFAREVPSRLAVTVSRQTGSGAHTVGEKLAEYLQAHAPKDAPPWQLFDRDLAEKVLSVYKGVVEVIAQFRPEAMAVEQLYAHYDHPRTAILMGHARGVILLAAAQQGIPIINYASTQVKKIVTGNGRASKDQVQRTIQRELGLADLPDPPDVADALAVALCHYYQNKLQAPR